ncbi:MAG: hypothetical protein Ct9H300mP12_04240 [Acidimicrobiales bacterium]|nr:MAG: hypothetical protein Ct9H300mP12_04240 [Acidimicrobiales bacterium]
MGLAFPDVLQVRGEYQVKPPPPFTPGSETAGTVVSVGDGVSTDLLGRRVVALGGGLAEQIELPASQVFEVPEGLSAAKAAAIPLNYCTTGSPCMIGPNWRQGRPCWSRGGPVAWGRRQSSWGWLLVPV